MEDVANIGISIELFITIIIGVCAIVGFAFGWIIRLKGSQSRGAIKTIHDDNLLDTRLVKAEADIDNIKKFVNSMPQATEIVSMQKDLEYMKKEQTGMASKVENLAGEVGTMRVSVQETSLATKALRERMDTFGSSLQGVAVKLNGLDKKIDMILAGLNKRRTTK